MHLLIDLMRGFASAKRGSDLLWEFFVKKITKTPHPNEAAKTAAVLRLLLEVEVEPKGGSYFGLSLDALLPLLGPGLVGTAYQKYCSQACEDLYRVALTYPGISDEDALKLQAAVWASGPEISPAHLESIRHLAESSVARRGGKTSHLWAAGLASRAPDRT